MTILEFFKFFNTKTWAAERAKVGKRVYDLAKSQGQQPVKKEQLEQTKNSGDRVFWVADYNQDWIMNKAVFIFTALISERKRYLEEEHGDTSPVYLSMIDKRTFKSLVKKYDEGFIIYRVYLPSITHKVDSYFKKNGRPVIKTRKRRKRGASN